VDGQKHRWLKATRRLASSATISWRVPGNTDFIVKAGEVIPIKGQQNIVLAGGGIALSFCQLQ
jgi:uncharacterized protein YbcV (DUF1398 family)